MDATDRPLHTLEAGEVDSYIDDAIDRLFVPRAKCEQATKPSDPVKSSEVGGEEPPGGGNSIGTEGVVEPLHEALLSLDWEVSERNIEAFEERIRDLTELFPRDKHIAAVAQMAVGVCKYLLTLGESASPLGVQFPGAAVHTLEVLLGEPTRPAKDRKAAVEGLLEKYRRLQSEVRRRRTTTTPPPAGSEPEGQTSVVAQPSEALPTVPESTTPVSITLVDQANEAEKVETWPAETSRPSTVNDQEEDIEELEPLAPESDEEEAPEPVTLEGQGDVVETTEEPAATVLGEVDSGAPVDAQTCQAAEVGAPETQPTTAPVSVVNRPPESGDGDEGTGQAERAEFGEAQEKAFSGADGEPQAGPTKVRPAETVAHEGHISSALAPSEDAGEGQPFGEIPGGTGSWAAHEAQGIAVAALRGELSTIRETLTGLLAAVERLEARLAHLPESAGQPPQG